jgi:Glycosyl transferase family 2
LKLSSVSNYRAEDEDAQEERLDAPLEAFLDPWPVLRRQAAQMQPGECLKVRYGAGAPYRLHSADVANLLRLTGFDPERPRSVAEGYEVEAERTADQQRLLTCSVIVPCRNEVGNIDELVQRVPNIGTHTQLVFIDGASTDGTIERIEENIRNHPERDIVLLHQKQMKGGKGSAVFQAFDEAEGDVIMILDADMTVAPEDLPRFFLALSEGHAQFANGVRMTFPMEDRAMQPANILGNRAFARLFSWLLGTRITDTLCGTKVLFREDWDRVRDARPLFGGFDPFGDFDLLFAARYAGLRMVDVPVYYHARTSGETKIHRWRDGVYLSGTCLTALRVFKMRRAR